MREFSVASHHLILQPILHFRSPHRSNHPYSVLKSFSDSSSKFTALETDPAKLLMLAPTVFRSTAALTQCAVEYTCFYKGTCGAVSTEVTSREDIMHFGPPMGGAGSGGFSRSLVPKFLWAPSLLRHSHWSFNHTPFIIPSGLHTIERKLNSSMHLHHE